MVVFATSKTSRGVVVISIRNPLAQLSAVTLSTLRDEGFIALSQEDFPQGYRTLQEVCHRAGFEPRITREAASIETLLLYVEAGIGISLMSENSRFISNPNVRLIPLDDLSFDNVIYWRTNPIRPSVQAAVEFLL